MTTRIVAGQYRRRLLDVPDGKCTRPTLVRLKESLFSFLGDEVTSAKVCDLFAGSGSLGFEAISRGASSVVFVEKDRSALTCLRRNKRMLRLGDEIEIVGLLLEAPLPRTRATDRMSQIGSTSRARRVRKSSGSWKPQSRLIPRLRGSDSSHFAGPATASVQRPRPPVRSMSP